jgi:hypothetical protein
MLDTTRLLPASSGKITRHRLSRGGDRAANNALYRIALVRTSAHPQTRDYVQRQDANGRTKKEILRLLKRAIAREVFSLLTRPHPVDDYSDLRPARQAKNHHLENRRHSFRRCAPAGIGPIASFPPHFFLENLAVRADGSILVTVLNHKQLWYVPAPEGGPPVTPVLVHTVDGFAMGIIETESDIFYVSTLDQATLERFDMRGWVPGALVQPTRVLTFDQPAGLNGACLLPPRHSARRLAGRFDLASRPGRRWP